MGERAQPEAEYFLNCNMQEAETRSLAGGKLAVFTARSPAKDGFNEDAVALIPYSATAGVLAVADGVGGLPDGQHASNLAVRELAASIGSAASRGEWLREAILNGIEAANRAVLERNAGGTTLALAEIRRSVVRPYHVGDSLILVTGQRGRIKLQTVPHSPVGYAVESGLLDERTAMLHEDRHLIDNMIGSRQMRIEIGPILRLAARDTLLVASDGLSDNLLTEEIVQRVRKGPLHEVVRSLQQICRKRMQEPDQGHPSKPDDLSFVAFRLGPGTPPPR